jgi:purine-binding chemotaxis protein CheW
LIFSLAGKRYAFSTACISEVIQVMTPTPMPGWPNVSLGVIEVRGDLLPLIDISPLVGLPPTRVRIDQLIVLLVAIGTRWGILVDRVAGVRPLSVRESTKFTPGEIMSVSAICRGIASDGEGSIIVLDSDGLVRLLPELATRDRRD